MINYEIISASINKEIFETFVSTTEEKNINRSALIQQLIKNWLSAENKYPKSAPPLPRKKEPIPEGGYLKVREGRLFISNREEE